jgi:hypothetical protein
MAEPDATLTALTADPEHYRGKVVLMSGTIVDEKEHAQYLWLRAKNRPLDKDYAPHRPVDTGGPEAGHYWVKMPQQQVLREYRHWVCMTVVGRVTGTQRLATESVLSLLYVRGSGISPVHDGVWKDSTAPNNIPSVPAGIGGEFSPRLGGWVLPFNIAEPGGARSLAKALERFHLTLVVLGVEMSPPSVM